MHNQLDAGNAYLVFAPGLLVSGYLFKLLGSANLFTALQ